MLIVELGLKLDKELSYYDNLLKSHNLENKYNFETHDIYYTNINLDGMSENEMKNSCVRIRKVNNNDYIINNQEKFKELDNVLFDNILNNIENELINKGFKKVFDTIKKDHHYCNDDMKSRIQLQEIKDIGILVYYDNPDYYNLSLIEQRTKLIDELNSYGFNFTYDIFRLDKLRTLYYKKEMYSNNQNG